MPENIPLIKRFSIQGKKIKCSTSQAKHKLFIGNVPRTWGEEDMKKVVAEIGPGVITVELLKVCNVPSFFKQFFSIIDLFFILVSFCTSNQ